MTPEYQKRAEWLARNVLPYESSIRSRLGRIRIPNLDVDDVIQEMYAQILSAPSLEVIRFPRNYAVQVAKRIMFDHLRRLRVVSIVLADNLDELDVPVPEESAEERLIFQGEIKEVAEALALLPEPCWRTLILRRVGGLSQKEAAERLGVTENVIEYRMVQGVKALVKIFGRGGKPKAHTSNNAVGNVTLEDEPVERRD